MAELQPTMPVIPGGYNMGTNTPGLGGIGLVGLVGLNNLFGNGFGNVAPTTNILEQTLGHIRKDVSDAALEAAKVESRIQAAIQVQDTNNNVNFRALDNKICETEKSAIIYAKDSAIEALKTEARVADRITAFERNADGQFCDVKKDIMGVNFNLEKVNTHLTHTMDKGFAAAMLETERKAGEIKLEIERRFCHLREEQLEDEVESLRACKAQLEQNNVFAGQFAAINSALINLNNQTQHLTNSVINFGSGAVGAQSVNSNQVRS